jgi:AcrR family transcriptional regulator
MKAIPKLDFTRGGRKARAKRGRPRRGEMVVRWDRILDAAAGALLRHGYGKVTIAKIARAVGVSTKTIYAKYANKAELTMDVVRRLTDASRRLLARVALDPEKDLATVLREFGSLMCAHWNSPVEIALFRLVIAEGPRLPELYSMYDEIVAQFHEPLVALLAARIRRGEMIREKPMDLASAFVYLCWGDLRERVLMGQSVPAGEIKRCVDFAVDAFIRAFCVTGPS